MDSYRTVATREAALQRMRAKHPAWDIHEVFGGYEAVPAGTSVVRSTDLEGLDEKLGSLGE